MKRTLGNPNLLFMAVLIVVVVLFLAARGQGEEKGPSDIGRYQITSCGTQLSWCVHVIDTKTGVVKQVDAREYGESFDEYK
ncbi:MAG: hypothetical protein ACYS47_09905 [Planctomycetota bacterium]